MKKWLGKKKIVDFLIVFVVFIILGIFISSGARLPTVGADTDSWGTILNTFLRVEHGVNGTHENITATGLNVTGDVLLPVASLGSCSGKLVTSSDGNITCGTDATGSGEDLSNYATTNESNVFTGLQNFTNSIQVGNSAITENGTIRWTGSDFQGYNGTQWVSLTTRADTGISPAFSVHRNGVSQMGVTTATWVKVNFTTEAFDTNDDYDTTNEWFKPSVPGKYLLTATVNFFGTTDYETDRIALYKNGVNVAEWAYDSDFLDPGPLVLTVIQIIDADGVNDYFEIYVYHESGSDEDIDGDTHQTYFSGSRIDGGNGLWTQNGINISYSAGNVDFGENMTLAADKIFTIQSNTTPIACTAADSGSIMYSSPNHYGCNGSDWRALY